ncbi:MAG: aminotransferase class V-fold PLP-dependent enzyme, partial [Acidimicrobiia bacterium]
PINDGEGEPLNGLVDPLGARLLERYRIQVPIFLWPGWPQRNVRISAAPYNSVEQYEALVEALKAEL